MLDEVANKNEVSDETSSPKNDNQSTFALIKLFALLQGKMIDASQLKHHFDMPERLPLGEISLLLKAIGFETTFEKGSDEKLFGTPLPALAKDTQGQWMIVGKADKAGLVVYKEGHETPTTMSLSEFMTVTNRQWVSVKVTSKVLEETETGNEKFGFNWFWRSLSKYKILMSEILMASFFVQVIGLITPLVFQVVIDKVLTNRTLTTLDVMVIALVGLSIFEILLSAMRHYLFSHTTNRIDVELGAKLFRHLIHLPLSYFESKRSGDTVARVRELENARDFMTGSALTSWLDLGFTFVYLALMFYYSPFLTCIVLGFLPLFFGASAIVTPILRKQLEDKYQLASDNQSFLVETVTSMETLKSHAVEPQWQRDWERRMAEYVNTSFLGGHTGNATAQFTALFSKLLTVALLYFGALAVIDGALSVGGLIAFNMLAGRVNAPILKLAGLWQEFTGIKVSIKRLGEILDAPAEPAFKAERSTPTNLQGHVKFDEVSFRYDPKLPEVLRDLSFEVKAGEIIGLVGVSGSGKTTLVRLIQRLYTPERGRILIDGMDLNLLDTSWLRRQMGIVGQDTLLFNRTVRENIALADQNLDMEAITAAAKLSGAHDFVLELPEGYDTVIGERGSKLSGGQRARIAIARALVTNPRLLVFDEATASLDYESERVIHDQMETICKGRTVFIIAHRLPTLRLANRILVLDRGKLIESGNHSQLMQAGGKYASLYAAHSVLEKDV